MKRLLSSLFLLPLFALLISPIKSFASAPQVDFTITGFDGNTGTFTYIGTDLSSCNPYEIEGRFEAHYADNNQIHYVSSNEDPYVPMYTSSTIFDIDAHNQFDENHIYDGHHDYYLKICDYYSGDFTIINNQLVPQPTATPTPTPPSITIGRITAPTIVQPQTVIPVSATFIDTTNFEPYTATWNWGDGTTSIGTVTSSNGSGSISGNHVYLTPGIYEVIVALTDSNNTSVSSLPFRYIVASVANPSEETGVPVTMAQPADWGFYYEVLRIFRPFQGNPFPCTYYVIPQGLGKTQAIYSQTNNNFGCDTWSPDKFAFQSGTALWSSLEGVFYLFIERLGENFTHYKSNYFSIHEGQFSIVTPTPIPTPTFTNPTVGTITAPTASVQTGTTITASANFTDPEINETHIALWNWGDGATTTGTVNESNGSGAVAGAHTYLAAGVYTVSLTVTDSNNGSGSQTFQYVTVFNPSAGWASGGKEFISPVGAVVGNAAATGKADFGFQVKYMNGDLVPSGKNVEFNFPAGNILFASTGYQWLVLNGTKAILKADGTLNGLTGYSILVSVIDQSSTNEKGLVRIQIKNANNMVVYDTQSGAVDTADPLISITKGKINVH